MVGFVQPTYSMIEDDGEGNGHTVEVTIQIVGNLDREVSVYLTLVPGTATGEYETSCSESDNGHSIASSFSSIGM